MLEKIKEKATAGTEVSAIRISCSGTYLYVGHPITVYKQQQRNKNFKWSQLTVICPLLLTQETCLWKIWKRQWDMEQGSQPITHCLFTNTIIIQVCVCMSYMKRLSLEHLPLTPTCSINSYGNVSHWHPFNLRLLSKEHDWGKNKDYLHKKNLFILMHVTWRSV